MIHGKKELQQNGCSAQLLLYNQKSGIPNKQMLLKYDPDAGFKNNNIPIILLYLPGYHFNDGELDMFTDDAFDLARQILRDEDEIERDKRSPFMRYKLEGKID